jgi:hypothetical protein
MLYEGRYRDEQYYKETGEDIREMGDRPKFETMEEFANEYFGEGYWVYDPVDRAYVTFDPDDPNCMIVALAADRSVHRWRRLPTDLN